MFLHKFVVCLLMIGWGTTLQTTGIASAASAASPAQADYVQIHNGRFELHDRPFVLRGVNYFGSWRYPAAFERGDGTEGVDNWVVFDAWDADKAARDFALLRTQLRATAIRIGTPARDEFSHLVQYHGRAPWYEADGSITDTYKERLIALADTAYAAGIRVQFCLLWIVSAEIVKNPDDFAPGGAMDRFYANQVRSIGLALRDHPGAIAFSIGNEVLVNWPTNGTHPSAYEGRAAAFIVRRLRDLRSVAPLQLLTTDEGVGVGSKSWQDPGPEFGEVKDAGAEAQPFRLVDQVDYLGPHFYPEVLKQEDLADDTFQPKLADAVHKLEVYMTVARATGKPVVLNEFGLAPKPSTLPRADYTKPQDAFYRVIAAAAERQGLQGLLSWGGLPKFVLRPADFDVVPSHVNQYSPVEVDVRSSGERILFYDPAYELLRWEATGDVPVPTAAAKALAATWPGVALPRRRPDQP
jgi:hypothetical protein